MTQKKSLFNLSVPGLLNEFFPLNELSLDLNSTRLISWNKQFYKNSYNSPVYIIVRYEDDSNLSELKKFNNIKRLTVNQKYSDSNKLIESVLCSNLSEVETLFLVKFKDSIREVILKTDTNKLKKLKIMDSEFNDQESFFNNLKHLNLEYLDLMNTKITFKSIENLIIKNLNDLSILNVSYCNIQSGGLKLLLKSQLISKLKIFEFEGNSIEPFSIQYFENVDFLKLEVLNLSKNKIGKGLKFLENSRFKMLKTLKLRDAEIESVDLRFLKNDQFSKLIELDLSLNYINSSFFNILGDSKIHSLKKLDLNQNSIEADNLEDLNKCKLNSLISLKISYNFLRVRGCQILINYDFPSLKSLELDCNQITSEGMKNFSASTFLKIQNLNLSQNTLYSQGLSDLCKCKFTYLKSLILDENELDDLGLTFISRCDFKSLETLSLNRNKISSWGLKNLSSGVFPLLTNLELSENKIDSEGIKFLKNFSDNKFRFIDFSFNLMNSKAIDYLINADLESLREINILGNEKEINEDNILPLEIRYPELKIIF